MENIEKKSYFFVTRASKILYFCVGFQELSHLTRDLSQAEKKITIVIATDKMTTIFTQNANFDNFE